MIGLPERTCEGGVLLHFSQPPAKTRAPRSAKELTRELGHSCAQPPLELLHRCFKAVKTRINERVKTRRGPEPSSSADTAIIISVRSPTIIAIMATAEADEM